jgi:hypothetical protein
MTHRTAAIASVAALSIACASDQGPAPVQPLERPPAPIRAFDLATIEELGRQIYAQDRFAWTASDALLANVDEKKAAREGVSHWITGTRDGHNVVRFIRTGDRGPEAAYDVTFAGLAEPTVSVPGDRTLTADEIAQYNARTLALANIPNRCSDRYNTVALRDPESDGWLVWALAATIDPDVMVIGGHFRFTISPDGQTIRQRDALSISCLNLPKKDGGTPFMSHLVSLTPVETHAFASLTYGKILHVGTPDGRAWRVDAGRIVQVDQDAPGEDGFAARALAAIDERCGLTVSKEDEKAKAREFDGRTKVIEATERDGSFSLDVPSGLHVAAITCSRKDIVPSPNDYKVIMAGYGLGIADFGEGHPERIGLLSRIDGKFAFEILKGEPLTEELQQRVDARLEAFQRTIQSKP